MGRRDLGERRDRREVAIHAEHAVGQQQRALVAGAVGRQQVLHMVEIVVTEDLHVRPRKRRARAQACVAQFVRDNQVAGADKGRNDAEVGEVA